MVAYQGRINAVALGGALAALLALSACSGGPATQKGADRSADTGSRVASNGYAAGPDIPARSRSYADTPAADPRRDPVPLVQGKPMWAANRRHTAEENADYQFNRDGADFGAQTVNDFVAKAHAFVDHPPQGVLTLTRANGDRLLYDAQGNVFAVVTKDGAPRAMFKPRDRQAYWEEQKARVAEQAQDGDSSDGRRYYSRRTAGGSSDDG